MDDAFGTGTIELLCCELKFSFSSFDIACCCGDTNLFHLRTHGALDRFVAGLANFCLTESLAGTRGIRHRRLDSMVRVSLKLAHKYVVKRHICPQLNFPENSVSSNETPE